MTEPAGRARLAPDTTERILSLRRELGVTSFGINQITLAPGQRMRIHRHAHQDEVYLVVEGELTVLIEREDTTVGAGELLHVAAATRRQLVNRGSQRVVVVAVGAAGEHEPRDAEAFHDWTDATGGSPREVPLPEDLPPTGRP